MKRLFVLGLIAVAGSGCATVMMPNGSTKRYFMSQVGVVVRVVNNCAPLLDLERVGGIVVKGLPFSESTTVPLVSTPFSGSSRRMPLTAKGYTAERQYLGSVTKEFQVNTYEGTHEEFWAVNQISISQGGRNGCELR